MSKIRDQKKQTKKAKTPDQKTSHGEHGDVEKMVGSLLR